MSRNIASLLSSAWNPSRGLVDWRSLIVLLGALVVGANARAEQLGADMLATSVAGVSPEGESAVPLDELGVIDEIVVIGIQKDDDPIQRGLQNDSLQQRLRRDYESHQQLDAEYRWRLEDITLEVQRPQLRVGYDLRAQSRGSLPDEQRVLPLDVVMPATVISVDF